MGNCLCREDWWAVDIGNPRQVWENRAENREKWLPRQDRPAAVSGLEADRFLEVAHHRPPPTDGVVEILRRHAALEVDRHVDPWVVVGIEEGASPDPVLVPLLDH